MVKIVATLIQQSVFEEHLEDWRKIYDCCAAACTGTHGMDRKTHLRHLYHMMSKIGERQNTDEEGKFDRCKKVRA